MSRDLGAPPTRDRDARDRERPLEVVSRAQNGNLNEIHVKEVGNALDAMVE